RQVPRAIHAGRQTCLKIDLARQRTLAGEIRREFAQLAPDQLARFGIGIGINGKRAGKKRHVLATQGPVPYKLNRKMRVCDAAEACHFARDDVRNGKQAVVPNFNVLNVVSGSMQAPGRVLYEVETYSERYFESVVLNDEGVKMIAAAQVPKAAFRHVFSAKIE